MPRIATFAFLLLSTLAFAQDSNFATGPQYLMNYGTPMLFHSIQTPSLSLSAPAATSPNASPEQASGEPHTRAFEGLPTQAAVDRIYWGVPTIPANNSTSAVSEAAIFISSRAPTNLPVSLFDSGVTSMRDTDSAYGIPLADIARAAKAAHRPARRVFTNHDLESLHSH